MMDQPRNPRIPQFSIRPAQFPGERDLVEHLFRDYQENIQVDLCFQSFEEELRDLPGKYVSVLIAEQDGKALGCVALRPMEGAAGEIKRLFVYPRGRGLGVGRALLGEIVAAAKRSGFETLRLDTVEDKMAAAIELYRKMGFREIGRRETSAGLRLLDMELTL